MSDLPPGFVLDPPKPVAAGALPPGFVMDSAPPAAKPSILDRMWGGAAPKPAAEGGGGILDKIWNTPFIQRMREPNAGGSLDLSKATGMQPEMERSAQIGAEHPYQPGMTAGQMMRGRPEDPVQYGFSPGNLSRVAPMAPRNPAATARLQDFEGQGITPSLPAVGQGRATGLVAQAGRILPFSPVQRGVAQNTLETQAATERAASQYGSAADEFAGGNVARNAMTRFAADRTQAQTDFGDFFNKMQGAPDVPIVNTLRSLPECTRSDGIIHLRTRHADGGGITAAYRHHPRPDISDPQPVRTADLCNADPDRAARRQAEFAGTSGNAL